MTLGLCNSTPSSSQVGFWFCAMLGDIESQVAIVIWDPWRGSLSHESEIGTGGLLPIGNGSPAEVPWLLYEEVGLYPEGADEYGKKPLDPGCLLS